MKTLRFALLALLLAIGLAGAAHAQVSADIHIGAGGRAAVDLGYFYDDLASYGNWIERPSYGWVWTPRSVAASWQPYQSGHWVATDQGWTWVTSEPYGWATYHYGRWYDDPEIGWSWVPGNEWAPSWVSFQEGNNYIGWAPLPPSVTIASGFDGLVSVSLAPAAYLFVPEREFLAPSLGSYYVPRDRVDVIYRGTRNLTNYSYSGDRVYNRGVSVDRIQQVVGRPVTRYQLADLRTRGAARVQGNQVQVFRPQVQKANVQPPSARPVARKAVVNAAQFQQSHPDRAAARRAIAQGTAQGAAAPARQPATATAQAKPARPAKVNPAQQPDRNGQNTPNPAAKARARTQASQPVEATPPARQRKANQQQPAQTEQQRPAAQPKRQRQPATEQQQAPPPARQPRVQPQQDRQQRPPQDNPPPQRQQRQQQPQAEPKQQRQQQPPPQQNPQRQQRQQEKDKQQQDDHKPPQR
jgi:hypothetical protein